MSLDKTKRIRSGNRSFVTKIMQNAHDAIDKFGGTQTERDQLKGYKIMLEEKKRILETLKLYWRVSTTKKKSTKKYLTRTNSVRQLIGSL